MRIALLQLNLIVGDLEGNAAQICAAAAQAQAAEADLAITSELALMGYPPRDLLLYPAFVDRALAVMTELAQSLPPELPVLVGSARSRNGDEGRPLFNSAAWLEGGEIRQWFDKRLLPTYDVFDEDRYFEPRQELNLMDFRGQRLGITICEDIWNDHDFWHHRRYTHDPVQEVAAAGATVLLNLSASPFSVGKQAFRERMLGSLARRHQIPVVYVNQVGGNDDLIFDGSSFAVSPQGHVMARGAAFDTDLVLVDLTTSQGTVRDPLPEPMAEIDAALVLGTRDYVHKCGFRQVVLGLSGGIDSSVTAAIAVAALGAENVLGVLMPSPYSSSGSLEDAWILADKLGISTCKLPIQPIMEAYAQVLAEPFAGRAEDITEENLQSRIRGNLLMALSNKLGHMLLTTGNKSELAVGYCTIYGDMSGGLAVISDLMKTQVYALADWINREREIIPAQVISKPPSAELKQDQKDSDSLPPYELLDQILIRHIEQHQSTQELVAAGFDLDIVQKIVGMVRRAEFKRKQAPPGLRVTDLAFGTGWRMPIARR